MSNHRRSDPQDDHRTDVAHATPLEIACDESGSEGENLLEGGARVFAHGSVDLSIAEAEAIAADLRKQFRLGSGELKSKALLKAERLEELSELFWTGGVLHGRARVGLVDKLYFAVGKVIDLLVEEEFYSRGIHLHVDGSARAMAATLFDNGRRALGSANWDRLLRAFVSLVRKRQRVGVKVSLAEFFEVIDDVRLRSHRKDVDQILALIWASRGHAAQYTEAAPGSLGHTPHLDPLISMISPTAHMWAESSGRPVLVVHDRQSALTPEVVREMVMIANNPHPDFNFPVPLAGITQVDSRTDPRVQIADLVAGIGRRAGEMALDGELPEGVMRAVRPMIHPFCIWQDEASWVALSGNRIGE